MRSEHAWQDEEQVLQVQMLTRQLILNVQYKVTNKLTFEKSYQAHLGVFSRGVPVKLVETGEISQKSAR